MHDLVFAEELKEILKTVTSEGKSFDKEIDLKVYACCRNEKWAEFKFEPKEWCLNPFNEIENGVVSGIIESSMQYFCSAYTGKTNTAAEHSISYLKPMQKNCYIVRVELIHVEEDFVKCTGTVKDENQGETFAIGMASLVLLSQL